MGTIFDELLAEVQTNDEDETIRKICDTIYAEEEENFAHKDHRPIGPNIFLSLEIPSTNPKGLTYLALERESSNQFILGVWTKRLIAISEYTTDISLKRIKVWPVKYHDAKRIMKEFAEKFKFLKGE